MTSVRGARSIWLAALGLCAGCDAPPKPLYHWGCFDATIFDTCRLGGEADLMHEIQCLNAVLEADQASGQRPAPGMHAQLGYLYSLANNPVAAAGHFEAEKAFYPESAKLMDRILAKLKT